MIKIHCHGGKVFEGSIFAVDPVSKAVVLRIDGSFTLIPPNQITKIEGDTSAFSTPPDIVECGVNVQALEKKEIVALDAADKSIASLNFSVSAEIQTLFDRLAFIWQGNTMVVLDDLLIEPPYDAVVVSPNADAGAAAARAGLPRVSTVLEGARKKLNL